MDRIDKIEIINNGEKFVYDVLFMFYDNKTKKEYVIYTDEYSSHIMAAIYNKKNNSITYIEDKQERKMVEAFYKTIKDSIGE